MASHPQTLVSLRRRSRRHRILALLTFRNEMRYLPDFFANVAPQVDGVIALDDGSSDGSTEWVEARPEVLQLIVKPAASNHVWNDAANHRSLVEASWEHAPDWLLGVDADERLAKNFRPRAEREIDRAHQEGHLAYRLRVHELWDAPTAYRCDGIWGQKSSARFFAARRDHEFHELQLHCYWAPLNSRKNGDFPFADLELYHLRMLHAEDREWRRARYAALDPENKYQTIGYDYMTDSTDLELKWIPWSRRYRPLPG